MAYEIPFDALRSFEASDGSQGRFVSIEALEEYGAFSIRDMPYTCLLYTSPSPRDS